MAPDGYCADWGTPTPGCFCKRVRNRLKTKELSFVGAQKSAQEYQKKRDRSDRAVAISRIGIVGTHPAVFVRVANTGLRRYGTWKSAQPLENKERNSTSFARDLCAREWLNETQGY